MRAPRLPPGPLLAASPGPVSTAVGDEGGSRSARERSDCGGPWTPGQVCVSDRPGCICASGSHRQGPPGRRRLGWPWAVSRQKVDVLATGERNKAAALSVCSRAQVDLAWAGPCPQLTARCGYGMSSAGPGLLQGTELLLEEVPRGDQVTASDPVVVGGDRVLKGAGAQGGPLNSPAGVTSVPRSPSLTRPARVRLCKPLGATPGPCMGDGLEHSERGPSSLQVRRAGFLAPRGTSGPPLLAGQRERELEKWGL